MKRKKILISLAGAALCFALFFPMTALAQEREEEISKISGVDAMYDSLDPEAKGLLSRVGVDSVGKAAEVSEGKLFQAFSQMLKEKLAGPLKAAAALISVILICRLANCFENSEIGGASSFIGCLACTAIVAAPLTDLIAKVKLVAESASAFLLASAPVCSALLAASGSAAAGASYSFLTVAAGNAIPILAAALILPMLHIFLILSIASSVSSLQLGKAAQDLYGFSKWLMVLAVTVFSGVISVQAALNANVDAATNKAAKLVASSAIPIVGSAFGDAVAAIQNSVGIVKSGAGAFGILAALFIFVPAALEAVVWIGVCKVGQIAGDLFEISKISAFLGACASVARMILAVIASIGIVSVVCAAIVLFVKGNQ